MEVLVEIVPASLVAKQPWTVDTPVHGYYDSSMSMHQSYYAVTYSYATRITGRGGKRTRG